MLKLGQKIPEKLKILHQISPNKSPQNTNYLAKLDSKNISKNPTPNTSPKPKFPSLPNFLPERQRKSTHSFQKLFKNPIPPQISPKTSPISPFPSHFLTSFLPPLFQLAQSFPKIWPSFLFQGLFISMFCCRLTAWQLVLEGKWDASKGDAGGRVGGAAGC